MHRITLCKTGHRFNWRQASLALALSLLFSSAVSSAQNPNAPKATAAVSGKVIIEVQAVPNAQVLIRKKDNQVVDSGSISALTDAEGKYKINNLAAGTYTITVHAPAHVIDGDDRSSIHGRTLEITEGENVENIDFSLRRGGVITGKVTDTSNRPVINESVFALRLDEPGKSSQSVLSQMFLWLSGDRGIYRIFGLEPGRYIVGAGTAGESLNRNSRYKRTYHPDAAEEAKATIIEVKAGGETENVDIKLTRAPKSYLASGRVIDAETNEPIPGAMIQYAVQKKDSAFPTSLSNITTNSNGEFRIEGLQPNNYLAFNYNIGQSDTYADPINFEIVNKDISGLELKMVRGGSISGIAIIEGTQDQAILSQLSKIQLRAEKVSQDTTSMMMTLFSGGSVGRINPDGSFKITGVRPGKIRIQESPQMKGFSLTHIEHSGIEIKELNISQGEQLTGLRVVFTYGTGVLAGHIEFKGGELPPNSRLTVRIVPEGASPTDYWVGRQANVDSRGQFTIEGISLGNYKAHLLISLPNNSPQINLPKVEQPITFTGNTRQEITLVLDLTKKEAANERERSGN